MKIESSDQTIADLFNSGYFVIPRFQRPYSWDQENISEFWDDVVRNKPTDYFIGSMVVYRMGDRKFGVVDGQQRLTTITILLCVLRDALEAEQQQPLAAGLHQLIERKNIDNELEFVLQTQSSYPYFQDYIQKAGEPELDIDVHREEKRLAEAHDQFQKLVSDLVSSIKSDPRNTKERTPNIIRNALTQIRDTLLGLKVIFVRLEDEDDAYIIFETLNTRGKDLGLADLVKNHFTRLIKERNKGLDHAKDQWQKLRETIEGSKVDISTDTFIHHYWLSKYEYITAKTLFKSFKKHVNKGNAKHEITAMLQDAKYYRSIHEVEFGSWTKQESEVSGALNALMLFRVRQQVPCVLSLVRAYRTGVIKKKSLETALSAIENFHFQFTAITSQRSSGGISGMYAALARRIYSANNSQEVADIIKEIKQKLSERVPSDSEFVALFPELLYTNTLSKQRALVKYVLVKMAKSDQLSLPGNWDDLTIEHIIPQTKIDDGVYTEEIIGQMGNLLLVPAKLNEKLKDKSFSEKKRILTKERYPLPQEIASEKEWTADSIMQRTEQIALNACQNIWRI
ncbi:MAG: DUF262 domain-containing HNH endonuclease family protein [Alcanivorax sp.]